MWKGRWNNAPVAIKKVKLGTDPAAYRHFAREAQLMCSLQHPNIVTTYGLVKAPLAIVMEYLALGSLRDRLKSDRFETDQKFEIIEKVCNGMVYLHSLGLVHRDLAARNIRTFPSFPFLSLTLSSFFFLVLACYLVV